jgi:hypothetical protein
MTSRHFSQTPPDKANELFDKLLATSDNALKTRERLFSDLKEELELLATLQEQHLFPILREHEMQDLLQEAIGDNEKTGALLAEIESMPKNNGEFLNKVAELRKVFQQHIRNDKKELLPAVLEVLSDEEASAVVEKVEDEVASFEETKRLDARRVGKQVEAMQQVPEGVADIMRVGSEKAQAVALGVQDFSREYFNMSQKRLQTNLDGFNKLTHCRTVQDLAELQTSLIRDNIELTLQNTFRIVDLAVQLTEKATRTVALQAEKTMQRANRAA